MCSWIPAESLEQRAAPWKRWLFHPHLAAQAGFAGNSAPGTRGITESFVLLKSGNKSVQNDLDWASLLLGGFCKPVTKVGSARAEMQLKSGPKSFGNPFIMFPSINWAGAEQLLPTAPGAGVCPYLLGVCVLVSDLLMEPLAFPGVHQEGRSPHRVPGVHFLQGSVCLRGQQELLRVPGGHLPELSQRLQAWGKVTRLCFISGGLWEKEAGRRVRVERELKSSS